MTGYRWISYAFGMLLAVTQVFAQAPKIGWVNSAKILSEYSEAVEANRKLDQMQKGWQQQLETMSKEWQGKVDEYQKKKTLMNPDQRAAQETDLTTQQQNILQFRQEKFGNDGELATATDSLLRPIKQRVMKVIEQVAKDQHIQFMFDRNEQIVVLLYGEAKADYTNLVIDRLKRGETSK